MREKFTQAQAQIMFFLLNQVCQ